MATTQICHHVFPPLPRRSSIYSHQKNALKPSLVSPLPYKKHHKSKWAVRMSVAEESPPKPAGAADEVEKLVDFLYEDLPHLFDDKGIDRTAYDERVQFRDPITKYDTITGYLANIAALKYLFVPDFKLHWAKKPQLVFTGTSVMGVNPETKKFCSHADYWDSITNNDYFSFEGLLDVIKQLRIYKTPDLESPKYQILKRTGSYEVRQYDPFIVVETDGNELSGSTGFNTVAGYIFGKNSTTEKIPMTTPVFTQAVDEEKSKVSIQIVLPADKELERLPTPNEESIKLRQVNGGIAAVLKFSGKPEELTVKEKEKSLRNDLLRDGRKPKPGCMLARYNDPGRTWSFIMRNEVLIWLEEFKLD